MRNARTAERIPGRAWLALERALEHLVARRPLLARVSLRVAVEHCEASPVALIWTLDAAELRATAAARLELASEALAAGDLGEAWAQLALARRCLVRIAEIHGLAGDGIVPRRAAARRWLG